MVIRAGEPRSALRFVLAVAGVGRVAAAQHVSGLEEDGLPIFVTTLDPSGAQWMLQWLAAPGEARQLIIWDTRLNRSVELNDVVIERHSAEGAGDGRADRFTLRAAKLTVVDRPAFLLRSMNSPQGRD